MRKLEQSVAVVTGAATGIGRALATRLADEGASLCLADINKEALEVVAQGLRAKGCDVSAYAVDVADRQQVEDLCRNVVEQFGRADLLINNAGVALCGDVEEVSLSDIQWLMGINFWGMVYGVKYFLPILKQQQQAYIVNLSSVFGMIAPPGEAAYSASKFACYSHRDCKVQQTRCGDQPKEARTGSRNARVPCSHFTRARRRSHRGRGAARRDSHSHRARCISDRSVSTSIARTLLADNGATA